MRLTQLFTGEKQIEDAGKTQKGPESRQQGDRQVRSLIPGQTVQGEVIERNGSQVQIRISEDLVLNARVDRNINLELGRNMTFEVKNNGNSLTLSPLFENTAADANVLKALDMAALPVNRTTVTMTEQLMEAGLPIDRNTLSQVYREVSAFPQADISDVVDLHKLGLPVNEDNLNQIAAYKNLTYQLETGMESILEALPQTVQEMLLEGDTQGVTKLWQELFSLLQESGPFSGSVEAAGVQGSKEEQAGTLPELMQEQPGRQNVLQQTIERLFDSFPVTSASESAGSKTLEQQPYGTEDALPDRAPEAALLDRAPEAAKGVSHAGADMLETSKDPRSNAAITPDSTAGVLRNQSAGEMLTGQDLRELLAQILEKLLTQEKPDGKTSGHTVQRGMQQLQKILSEGLRQLWTIKPEEVGDAKQVEALYSRLDRQLKTMIRAFQDAGQAESQSCKAAVNLTKNLDFLQQVNQAYTYVQLPLQMQQGGAHGDLYVFTNKKHLAAKEGQVSALLHLDMEHLGALDVYVAMQSGRVNTKFYVQDNKMLDFLEAHMELLTQRLQKRGYDCIVDMQVRENGKKETGGIRQLLQQENHVPLAQYAFDMRA